ncbi:ATP-binding cassette domain-containing protein [Corynebacterium sp. 153RC1]|uniref:ABC transporter ATP-binding protein n=1 Tax=unclassified Corynebacterium TaxID=2624378 RepID=UPI00211CEE2A|nr:MULTISPECIES: ATP-binding cassette domain-containing protein [unclassified Corynebacterium]MCQ9353384.1 ATP-binding cassette domain-containing protein [Corynebacterium sp. 209RC1]MCQ9355657.1 ATP-binding cassette domain-containing protein [Corynebacterium sp. 1222RC1]MCQ9357850.1 ATP-binding cassette domain-containing protein [Corynebacterium sp. 122RC1]MCQ9360034.1 ATP-binding cassette domain-containing protein [Corynebacterium sp. 142RC1]MCQ9362178.1 ATP-binding cassette domain-containing
MITFEAVSKIYPDGTAAVRNFSLDVPEGKIVAMVGSSGSGKTTLLRMVNRMVEPSDGAVRINGKDVRTQNPVALRRSIGYVLQHAGLLPHHSVADNVATVPVLNGVPKRKARQDALEVMARVGLGPELAKRYPAQLSGGQQQRVGVARALAANPEILLMDEPFGAVDPIVRRELQDELLRLQAELGKTILFVTHDIDEALRLGDHIVLLQAGGQVAQQGTPTELLTAPANDFVRSFIGADAPQRTLHITEVGGVAVAVDGMGRTVGRVASDGVAP